jgi:release factor glutamine methyltransferase
VEAGCDTPQLDAELLLGEVLECDRAELVLRADAPLSGEVLERFDQLIARRAAREPVAYILGRKDFRRIRLSVDPRVLIPRPETELLVEVGLSVARGARVLDVGTGSGAVALALKDERPDLFLVGVDVSPEALAVARDNAARLCLNVAFVEADLLPDEGPYDAVLANLPYVADGDPLPPEIELFEPGVALFAGADGLDVIRRLIPMLSEVPLVAVEVGVGQASAVADLFARAGFRSIEVVRDLARIDRVVVGRS